MRRINIRSIAENHLSISIFVVIASFPRFLFSPPDSPDSEYYFTLGVFGPSLISHVDSAFPIRRVVSFLPLGYLSEIFDWQLSVFIWQSLLLFLQSLSLNSILKHFFASMWIRQVIIFSVLLNGLNLRAIGNTYLTSLWITEMLLLLSLTMSILYGQEKERIKVFLVGVITGIILLTHPYIVLITFLMHLIFFFTYLKIHKSRFTIKNWPVMVALHQFGIVVVFLSTALAFQVRFGKPFDFLDLMKSYTSGTNPYGEKYTSLSVIVGNPHISIALLACLISTARLLQSQTADSHWLHQPKNWLRLQFISVFIFLCFWQFVVGSFVLSVVNYYSVLFVFAVVILSIELAPKRVSSIRSGLVFLFLNYSALHLFGRIDVFDFSKVSKQYGLIWVLLILIPFVLKKVSFPTKGIALRNYFIFLVLSSTIQLSSSALPNGWVKKDTNAIFSHEYATDLYKLNYQFTDWTLKQIQDNRKVMVSTGESTTPESSTTNWFTSASLASMFLMGWNYFPANSVNSFGENYDLVFFYTNPNQLKTFLTMRASIDQQRWTVTKCNNSYVSSLKIRQFVCILRVNEL